MRKQPTEAQKRAAQEKRDRFRELSRRVSAMTEEQRQELVGTAGIRTCEGRELSAKNQCLVASQHPRATMVGGFRQWISAGRCVRKGEHGFVIWVPGATPKDDAGESDLRFLTATVFDIAQTDALEAKAAVEVAA